LGEAQRIRACPTPNSTCLFYCCGAVKKTEKNYNDLVDNSFEEKNGRSIILVISYEKEERKEEDKT
jgi:hypothetical protein